MIEWEHLIKCFIYFLLGIIFGLLYPYVSAYLEGLFSKNKKERS